MTKLHFQRIILVSTLLAACGVEPSNDDEATTGQGALDPVPSAEQVNSPQGTHCVVAPPFDEKTCFASFREALASATGGAITQAPDDAKTALDDEWLAAEIEELDFNASSLAAGGPALKASIVLGIFYEDAGFEGSSLTVTGSRPCTGTLADIDASLAYVGNDMNDEISSFRTFASCFARVWEDANFGGSSIGFRPTMDYVGDVMNDEGSSIQLS